MNQQRRHDMMDCKVRTLLGLAIAGTLAFGSSALAQTSTKVGPDGKPATATQPTTPAKPDAHADKSKEKDKAKDDKKAKIGEAAPKFTLTTTEGKEVKLEDFKGKIVVLEWFNPECPYVKKHHEANKTMVETANKYKEKNVVWLAINSGAPGKQGHGKDFNEQARKDWKLPYPVALDESGDVGRAYGAKTTPHMFVINKDGVLVYAGAIDNDNDPKTLGDTNYVANAIEATIKGETIKDSETKPYGCGVKYASR
jgi:peroxiredoxin